MSSGKNPLMLMMALAMPGASHALGLGDIHVDSALNEHLTAQIDIVGATALELIDLRAAVANRETFQRHGAERPGFLSSTTFKVAHDSQGRPVLAVRSSESFTEPMVNFLVELRWHGGVIVREYTLLLDPAGLTPSTPVLATPDAAGASGVAATTAVAALPVEAIAQTAADLADQPDSTSDSLTARKTTHIKVGAKATLRGVAWRVGARSESDLRRMMIAIFRANPSAFDGNINRLHRGAVLTIPSPAVVAAISPSEAKGDFHAQMAAWRVPLRAVVASASTPPAHVGDAAVAVAAPAAVNAAPEADAALDDRVQSMEQELSQMRSVLKSEHDQLLGLQQQALRADRSSPAVQAPQAIAAAPAAQQAASAPRAGSKSTYSVAAAAAVPILAGVGMLSAALAALYFRFRRREEPLNAVRGGGEAADIADPIQALPEAEAQMPAPVAVQEPSQEPTPEREPAAARPPAPQMSDATQPLLPIISGATRAGGRSEISGGAGSRAAPQDTTVNMRADTRLDYNLMDLDLTAQHVQMPSVLNQHVVVKERRTNLADVLKMAIEREPDRHDLRLKLLELYYSAASTNRQAFLEVVQNLAGERNNLTSDQWDKIAFMGRQIAAENPLFAEQNAADDDLADCA
jgi:pilus assembly protein FimV